MQPKNLFVTFKVLTWPSPSLTYVRGTSSDLIGLEVASVPAVRSTQSSCRRFEVSDVISNNWREPSSQDWSGYWDEREQCRRSALRWVGQWTSVNAVADASRQQSNMSQLDNAQGSRRIHSTCTYAGVQGWSVVCPPCDKYFQEVFSSPTEAVGLHGSVTYSTKEIWDLQKRMLTWRLWLWRGGI